MQADYKTFAQGWAPPLEGNDATAAVEWFLKSSEDRFNRDPATLAQANGHQDVSDYLQSNN